MITGMRRTLAQYFWNYRVTTFKPPIRVNGHWTSRRRSGHTRFFWILGLPDLDGYQLASTIRAAPWGRSILLIAVTGWGQEEDRRRAFEAGCDHHLTKPIAAEAVESLLQTSDPALHNTN